MNEQIVRKVKKEMKKRLADICNNERLIKIGQSPHNSFDKVYMCVYPEVNHAICSVMCDYMDELLSLGNDRFQDVWYYSVSVEMIKSKTKKIAKKLYNPIS